MNFGCGAGTCDCLIWILILMCCCGSNSTYNNGCGCLLPIILALCCCGGGNGCGKC